MKSIANQYRDLKEGRMSQANFMRNLRMSMPQHVTNVTSFTDAVKILKSKSILTEAALGETNLLDELESEMENGKSYAEAISIVAARHGMGEDALATKYPEEAVGDKAYEDNYDYADDEYPSDYDTFSDYDDGEFWEGKEAEVGDPEVKVGDIVIPNKGPHEGMKHEVIHVFDDGSFNIKPVGPGLKAKNIKYKLGAARAKMSDVEVLAEAENPSLRSPEGVAEVVANKYADELIALRPNFKEFQNAALNFAGQEMLDGGMSKVAIRNLLSGFGYFEDWTPDYLDALDNELKTQSMVSKIEKEKSGEEAVMGQYDLEEANYPVAGEKGYIKVSDLKKGDTLGGSGLEIVSMSSGAKTPSGKIEVTVKDPKTGKQLTKLWNKSTTVRLKKEDLSEALNKDMRAFGQDVDKRLKEAGFKTLVLIGQDLSNEQKKAINTQSGLVAFEVKRTDGPEGEVQQMYLYCNPKEYAKVKKVVDKFQLSNYEGQAKFNDKNWTTKTVVGAINPGDIVKIEDPNYGQIWFYRYEKVERKVKTSTAGGSNTYTNSNVAQQKLAAESLEEAKKKKEAKPELHPNLIHPQELRMGIKVELEHTDDLDKAKKIALDHLAENPYYYTALKLSGIESPSVFTAKAPVKKVKKEKVELVDKENQMKPVSKKKLKEAKLNIDGEPNAVVKQAMAYVDSNPMLKIISDDIEFQQSGKEDEAILRYGYWEELPDEAIAKLKLQFNVEEDLDYDTNTGDMFMYLLTPKAKTDSTGLGASFDKFKSQLEEMIREAVNEMQSDEQETDEIATELDEYFFDGRDNLADEIAAQQK